MSEICRSAFRATIYLNIFHKPVRLNRQMSCRTAKRDVHAVSDLSKWLRKTKQPAPSRSLTGRNMTVATWSLTKLARVKTVAAAIAAAVRAGNPSQKRRKGEEECWR